MLCGSFIGISCLIPDVFHPLKGFTEYPSGARPDEAEHKGVSEIVNHRSTLEEYKMGVGNSEATALQICLYIYLKGTERREDGDR